jgi:hypothetical protein
MNLLSYQIVEALLDFDPRRRGSLQEDHQAGEAKEVIYKDRVQKDGIIICPHCNNEIPEKGTYSDDDLKTTRHRACDGIIKFRPPDDETLAHIERAWGIKFNKETNEWTPIDFPSTGKREDEEPDDYDEYD